MGRYGGKPDHAVADVIHLIAVVALREDSLPLFDIDKLAPEQFVWNVLKPSRQTHRTKPGPFSFAAFVWAERKLSTIHKLIGSFTYAGLRLPGETCRELRRTIRRTNQPTDNLACSRSLLFSGKGENIRYQLRFPHNGTVLPFPR